MEGLMFKIVKKVCWNFQWCKKKQERKMDNSNIETSKICSAVIFIIM